MRKRSELLARVGAHWRSSDAPVVWVRPDASASGLYSSGAHLQALCTWIPVEHTATL